MKLSNSKQLVVLRHAAIIFVKHLRLLVRLFLAR